MRNNCLTHEADLTAGDPYLQQGYRQQLALNSAPVTKPVFSPKKRKAKRSSGEHFQMEELRCMKENIKNNLKLFINICYNLEHNYEETKQKLKSRNDPMPTDQNLTIYLNNLMRVKNGINSNETFQQHLPPQENMADVILTDQN